MKSKQTLNYLLFFIGIIFGTAQEVTIAPARIKSDYTLSEKADTQIIAKMQKVLNKSGIIDYENAVFALVPEVSILSEHTSSGIPPIAEVEYELSFSVMNIFDGKTFATHSFKTKGRGSNKGNAIAMGLKNIDLNSPIFSEFLERTKSKIISHYERELPKMIQRINIQVGAKNYEEALFILSQIPEAIPSYASKILPLTEKVYKSYEENLGKEFLQRAKSKWAISKDEYTASEVAELLSQIPVETSAYKESQVLLKNIDKYIANKDVFYRKLREKEINNAHLERKAAIEAIRAIGVAYGKNAGTKVVLWK
ncbi:hypothetical protein [Riemerella anatipestifer]|uniref:hypothetical protein n=1 Tax=Riemerella anatipestifer TaxID=34085 RepID=UPI00129E787C|nr:hypothetical protein [Riemerella anatipestifer]MRM83863.1 hypothetical protein [Riemerella anatipestifer]